MSNVSRHGRTGDCFLQKASQNKKFKESYERREIQIGTIEEIKSDVSFLEEIKKDHQILY